MNAMAGDGSLTTRSQQKRTVSGKKSKKCIRNTLVNPYDIEWPTVEEDAEDSLLCLVRTLLVRLNRPKLHIKLGAIRSVAKEERRHFRRQQREKLMKEAGADDWSELRSSVALGVNHVSRSLEKGEAVSALVARDVDPAMLTRFLVPLAATRGLPLLALRGLARATQEVLGFRCVALAFKNSVESDSHPFHPLHDRVKQLSAQLPPSVWPPYERLKTINIDEITKEILDAPGPSDVVDPGPSEVATPCRVVSTQPTTPKTVMLHRTTNKYRIFIPKRNEGEMPSTSESLPAVFPILPPSPSVSVPHGAEDCIDSSVIQIIRPIRFQSSNNSNYGNWEGTSVEMSDVVIDPTPVPMLASTKVLGPSCSARGGVLTNQRGSSRRPPRKRKQQDETDYKYKLMKIKRVQCNLNKRTS